MSRLFHIVAAEAWRAHVAGGGDEWRPSSLTTEGFCHLSFSEQLAGTLAAHFAPTDELLLVELRPAALDDALRIEPSRGGEPFPHLYRAVRAGDVLRVAPLVHDGAAWTLPL